MEIQGIELAHRYAKLFRVYHGHWTFTTIGWVRITRLIQFLLHNELGTQLSSTLSFETIYKAQLVRDLRRLLIPNREFKLKYRNCLRPVAIDEADFEGDPQILRFEDDPGLQSAVCAGVDRSRKAGRQYWANFLLAKTRDRSSFSLNLFAIETNGHRKLKAE